MFPPCLGVWGSKPIYKTKAVGLFSILRLSVISVHAEVVKTLAVPVFSPEKRQTGVGDDFIFYG